MRRFKVEGMLSMLGESQETDRTPTPADRDNRVSRTHVDALDRNFDAEDLRRERQRKVVIDHRQKPTRSSDSL